MELETLFSIANMTALVGWLILLFYRLAPRVIGLVSGVLIPLVLAVGYTALIAVYLPGSQGGFDSLANVSLLFENPGLLLAGWLHYLAFDLFIGCYIMRTGHQLKLSLWLVLLCLPFTFMFGPVGLLLFYIIRYIRDFVSQPDPANHAGGTA